MVTKTNSNKPPRWLALHFPQLAEQDGLERLASWCYQYSSQVCIKRQHNGLLLEIAGSQRLFGHAETLTGRITTELEQLGHHVCCGIAPTPEAAHMAVRHGLFIRTLGDIRKSIGALSIDSLNLQRATRSESHLMMLLHERLERLQLPRPVRFIRLQALNFLPCAVLQTELLRETGQPSTTADNAVIERLQARLGKESV